MNQLPVNCSGLSTRLPAPKFLFTFLRAKHKDSNCSPLKGLEDNTNCLNWSRIERENKTWILVHVHKNGCAKRREEKKWWGVSFIETPPPQLPPEKKKPTCHHQSWAESVSKTKDKESKKDEFHIFVNNQPIKKQEENKEKDSGAFPCAPGSHVV